MPILPAERDPRFITVRRGGTLTDANHRLLAVWAVECAEHVLPFFASTRPDDDRPRHALEVARGWIRGEVRMSEAHNTAFLANAAARETAGAAKYAALAAGQAVAVAHVAAHELGAAAYAIRAARAAVPEADGDRAALAERDWQRERLPDAIRELVLDDQRLRDDLCWNAFTDPARSE